MSSRVHCRLTFTSTVSKPVAAPLQDCERLSDALENALSAPTNVDPGKESRAHFKGNNPNLRIQLIQRILCVWWFLGLALLIPLNVNMISLRFSFCVMLVEKRVKTASPVYGLLQLESRDGGFGRGGPVAVNSKISWSFNWLWMTLLCNCFYTLFSKVFMYKKCLTEEVSFSQIKRHMQISYRLYSIETKTEPKKTYK